jgi:aminoglycoside 3-N-acetyltransferase
VYSRHELTEGFRALGVAPGDTVMLHASVRSVGRIAGGPDQIHLALKDALTWEGTLLMYAGCPDHYDEVGNGTLSPEEERELIEKLPSFDPLTARSARDNGALVELFRTYPGSQVNAHVARFAVWGNQASHLISSQPWNYAYGRGSVLERFVELDGRILLLGSDPDAVTFLHYAEHVLDTPGKLVTRYRVPVRENGSRIFRDCEEFDTSERAHPHWPDRFFGRIVDTYLDRTGNRGGRVGEARAYLIDSSGLLEFALGVMAAVARDPAAVRALRA